jgi:3-phytase
VRAAGGLRLLRPGAGSSRRARRASARASVIAALLSACVSSNGEGGAPAGGVHVLEEAFVSAGTRPDNIDTPAVWHGAGGVTWLLATAKSTHRLMVYDAASGESLGAIGRPGPGPGELRRPNGLLVLGDLAFIVERDNRRIQVLRLPDAEPVGSFGEAVLRRPYGIAHVEHASGDWDIYVTDAYTMPFALLPPDRLLGERVKRFRVRIEDDTLRAELVSSFGETSGPGVLRQVESIHADPAHDRLLVADEKRGDIKVYTLDGRYAGRTLGRAYLRHEPEGIAMRDCGGGAGLWIVTAQALRASYFHVLDRRSLERIGAFRGRVTANTDGVALTQRRVGDWEEGVFYAVHDDRAVAAFPWAEIERAADLPGCAEPTAGAAGSR